MKEGGATKKKEAKSKRRKKVSKSCREPKPLQPQPQSQSNPSNPDQSVHPRPQTLARPRCPAAEGPARGGEGPRIGRRMVSQCLAEPRRDGTLRTIYVVLFLKYFWRVFFARPFKHDFYTAFTWL